VLAIAGLASQHALIADGWVGGAVQILAAVLMMWARLTFGLRSLHAAANPTAGGVVTSGPYAFLRHPIYAAILWFVWAGAVTHASPFVIGAALVITAGTAVRIAMEERLLLVRYPEYAVYAARVRRVIPFVW